MLRSEQRVKDKLGELKKLEYTKLIELLEGASLYKPKAVDALSRFEEVLAFYPNLDNKDLFKDGFVVLHALQVSKIEDYQAHTIKRELFSHYGIKEPVDTSKVEVINVKSDVVPTEDLDKRAEEFLVKYNKMSGLNETSERVSNEEEINNYMEEDYGDVDDYVEVEEFVPGIDEVSTSGDIAAPDEEFIIGEELSAALKEVVSSSHEEVSVSQQEDVSAPQEDVRPKRKVNGFEAGLLSHMEFQSLRSQKRADDKLDRIKTILRQKKSISSSVLAQSIGRTKSTAISKEDWNGILEKLEYLGLIKTKPYRNGLTVTLVE